MASAIRGGDALLPAATAVRITGGPDAPIVTDGPFAETAEVAGGYYLFEAENLDGHWLSRATSPPPSTARWRSGRCSAASNRPGGKAAAVAPDSPEWQALAAPHHEFMAAAGDHITGGAALHEPSTATTVRVRGGEVLITDGPYAEAPRWPTASMCSAQPTGTRPSSSRR